MNTKSDAPDLGWALIEIELTPGADVRYLSARHIFFAGVTRARRILYTSLSRSKAGWFRPNDAAMLCFGLVESGVYRATIAERA